MTELEKCAAGLWYDANFDADALSARAKAEELYHAYNTLPPSSDKRAEVLERLFPHKGQDVTVLAPVYADYGTNTTLGDRTFINHGAYFMDGAPITVGSNCFIGPSCGFYTAIHPILAEERNQGLERALPITIQDNVWIGANVIVLPGVTVGEGSVIGAGSVVTRNVPPGVVAMGNPCRVARAITRGDSIHEEQE